MTQTQPDSSRQCYLTVHEFAKRIGVHPQTVRTWEENGTFLPHHRTPGGHRRYTQAQVEAVMSGQIPLISGNRRDHNGQD